jgi:hypothetical protein
MGPYNATGNGSTDDTTAIQNAINAAQAVNGTVFIPAGLYVLTRGLTLSDTVNIIGEGFSAGFSAAGAVPNPPAGTILLCTFTTAVSQAVIYTNNRTKNISVFVSKIELYCTYQTNTNVVSWSPAANVPWAIIDERIPPDGLGPCHCLYQDIMIRNFNNGMKVHGSSGITIRGLLGRCYNQFLYLDKIYDVIHCNMIHCWDGFWGESGGTDNSQPYQRAHLNFITLGRVDNPSFDDIFCIDMAIGLNIVSTGDEGGGFGGGTLSYGQFSNVQLDGVYSSGIYIQNTASYRGHIFISNMYIQMYNPVTGATAVVMAGISTQQFWIWMVNSILHGSNAYALYTSGSPGDKVMLSNVMIDNFNQQNGGYAALQCLNGGIMYLSNVVVGTSASYGAAATNTVGTGVINGTAYTF